MLTQAKKKLSFNTPQIEFINSSAPFNCFCGGFRSGKSFVGFARFWILAANHPGINMAYYAPTTPIIKKVLFKGIAEVGRLFGELYGWECRAVINRTDKVIKLMINDVHYGTIQANSMHDPESIMGDQWSHAMVDEIDRLSMENAQAAWNQIIARSSEVRADYPVNTVDFTSTPEGHHWIYNFFIVRLMKDPSMQEHYRLIRAPTTQNRKNLPAGYIESLYQLYTKELADQYVAGEFVNITSGSVYAEFNREKNVAVLPVNNRLVLHVGIDFNIGKMSACFVQEQGDEDSDLHVIDEMFGARDTRALCEDIIAKYGSWGADNIYIYPDASGHNRSTTSETSDHAIIEGFGFNLVCDEVNPRVQDRVNSVNCQLRRYDGHRSLMIDESCNVLLNGIKSQAYDKNQKPSKDADLDHLLDALGYVVWQLRPVKKSFEDHY